MDIKKIINEIIEDLHSSNKISEIITNLIEKWRKEIGSTCKDINHGNCTEFANDLSDELKKIGIEHKVLYVGDFDDESDVLKYTKKMPPNLSWFYNTYHSWIYVDGKHYDAEAPEGVDDMFDLPSFSAENEAEYMNQLRAHEWESYNRFSGYTSKEAEEEAYQKWLKNVWSRNHPNWE